MSYEAPAEDPFAEFLPQGEGEPVTNPTQVFSPLKGLTGPLDDGEDHFIDNIAAIVRSDFTFVLPAEFTAAYSREYGNPAGDPAWVGSTWSPSEAELLQAAEKYDLAADDYAQLAYARAPEELELRAEVLGERRKNRLYVDNTYTGLSGFATRLGVNMFDPAFLIAGGGVGALAKGVKATTTVGRVGRNMAVAGIADGSVEFANASIDPLVSYQDAAINTAASASLTGVFSGVGEFIRHSSAERIAQRVQSATQAHYADARGTTGAKQLNALPRVMEDDAGNSLLGEIFEDDDYIFNVLDREEGVPDRNALPSFGAPVRSVGQSPDAELRGMGSVLMEDPTKANLQRQTVGEKAHRINESGGVYLRRMQQASQSYWRKRGQTSAFGGVAPAQVEEFDRIVHMVATEEIQGLPREFLEDPDIQAAVSALREGNAENLYLLQNRSFIPGPGRKGHWSPEKLEAGEEYTGVKGMESVPADPRYVKRSFSKQGYDQAINRYGEPRVREMFADAIYAHPDNKRYFDELAAKSKRKDLDGWTVARSVAGKYLRTVRTLMNEAEPEGNPYRPHSKADQKAALAVVERELAEELGDDAREALELFAEIIAPERQASLPNFAKRKLKLQLDWEKHQPILGIWRWDAQTAFASARRNIAGHVGFNAVGVPDVREWEARIARIERRAAGFPKEQKAIAVSADKLRRVTDLVMGVSRNKTGLADELSVVAKRYNLARLLNNVAFSMFGEIGLATTTAGPVRFAMQTMGVGRYYRAVRAGNKAEIDSWLAFTDDLMGHGSSQVRARLSSAVSERGIADTAVIGEQSRIMHVLDVHSRKMANAGARLSGMAPLTETLRLGIATNLAKRFYRSAKQGKLPLSKKRLRDLGIDDAMWQRISKSLKAMETTSSPTTGKRLPDFDRNWADAEAFEAFVSAIDRYTRRSNLDAGVGHTILTAAERPVWSVFTQFLQFPQAALIKHTGNALAMRDTQAAVQIMTAGAFSLLGVLAKVNLQAQAIRDKQAREEYLEKHLDIRRVTMKAIFYTPQASHLPTLIDVGAGVAGLDAPFSGARNSGLSNIGDFGANPFASNPTGDLLNDVFRLPGKLTDGTITEQDAQDFVRLMPFGNHLVVQAITNEFAQYLPDENE
jgi:hypothetical protein